MDRLIKWWVPVCEYLAEPIRVVEFPRTIPRGFNMENAPQATATDDVAPIFKWERQVITTTHCTGESATDFILFCFHSRTFFL